MEYPLDLSFIPQDDLVELVWDNGQLTMQSQSTRVRNSQNFKSQDKFVDKTDTSRVGRFGSLESFLIDAHPGMPSGEVDLGLTDDMVPWYDDLLPETSGVTMNELPIHSSLTPLNKRSCVPTFESLGNVSVFNSQKSVRTNGFESHSSKAGPMSSWPTPQGQSSVSSFVSGVSDILSCTTSSTTDVIQPSPSGSFCLRKIKDLTLPGSGSSLPNFPFLSRHTALVRAGLQKNVGLPSSCSSAMGTTTNEGKPSTVTGGKLVDPAFPPSGSSPIQNDPQNQVSSSFSKVEPGPSGSQPPKLPCSGKLTNQLNQEDEGKIVSHEDHAICATPNKQVLSGDNNVEHVIVSSSVCSGSSADRASDSQMQTLKRKDRDSEETEYRSEDVEEDSVGVRKTAPARGGTGSKRNRAAEVHNLSERRRRERINEKMKTLQELIPNCNKVDKASMLDEAIEYLKTLQLQIQMLSMGGGIYMPQMMFPAAMQHMYAAQVSHFAPMGMGVGMGMGMGMGYGMRMVDMNGGSPMFPVPPSQRPDFPSPSVSRPSNFSGLAISNLPKTGHPGQGHPFSVPRPPLEPSTGDASTSVVFSAARKESQIEVPTTSATLNSNDPQPL